MSGLYLHKDDVNLCDIVSNLMQESNQFDDSKDKQRVMTFIVELVQNGGHQTKAAIAAGYAESSAHVAASRLLSKDKIRKIYEKLQNQRLATDVLIKLLDKQHVVSLMYAIAMKNMERYPKQAITALDYISKLLGFYDEQSNQDDISSMAFEVVKAAEALKELKSMGYEEGKKGEEKN